MYEFLIAKSGKRAFQKWVLFFFAFFPAVTPESTQFAQKGAFPACYSNESLIWKQPHPPPPFPLGTPLSAGHRSFSGNRRDGEKFIFPVLGSGVCVETTLRYTCWQGTIKPRELKYKTTQKGCHREAMLIN